MGSSFREIEEVDEVSGACIMVRSMYSKEIGGWDEHFSWGYEDLNLCYRIKKGDGRYSTSPKPKLYIIGGRRGVRERYRITR